LIENSVRSAGFAARRFANADSQRRSVGTAANASFPPRPDLHRKFEGACMSVVAPSETFDANNQFIPSKVIFVPDR
jgi:hypothetical protein